MLSYMAAAAGYIGSGATRMPLHRGMDVVLRGVAGSPETAVYLDSSPDGRAIVRLGVDVRVVPLTDIVPAYAVEPAAEVAARPSLLEARYYSFIAHMRANGAPQTIVRPLLQTCFALAPSEADRILSTEARFRLDALALRTVWERLGDGRLPR